MIWKLRGLSKKLYLVAYDQGSEASFGLWRTVHIVPRLWGSSPIINLLSMLETVAIHGYNSAASDH